MSPLLVELLAHMKILFLGASIALPLGILFCYYRQCFVIEPCTIQMTCYKWIMLQQNPLSSTVHRGHKIFFKVFKYLTITQNPKKTSIWHTLSEKKITSTSKPIIGTPLFFSQWPRLVQPAPKQICGPMINLEVEVIFFHSICAKWLSSLDSRLQINI